MKNAQRAITTVVAAAMAINVVVGESCQGRGSAMSNNVIAVNVYGL